MKPSFALARGAVTEHKRILLAEDDDAFRAFLTDVLRDDGYEVVAVCDGRGLLERIAAALHDENELSGIDLILSDIRMPYYCALDVVRGLRLAAIEVPILLMTAFGDRHTHEQAKALGAVGVLNKPFEIDDLRTVVCNVLTKHGAGSFPQRDPTVPRSNRNGHLSGGL